MLSQKGCTGVQLTTPPPAQSTSRRSKLGNLQIFCRSVLPTLWNRPKQFPWLELILPLRLTVKPPPDRNTMVMEPGKQRVPTMPDWNDETQAIWPLINPQRMGMFQGRGDAQGSQWLIQHPQTLNKETRKKKHNTTTKAKPGESTDLGELFQRDEHDNSMGMEGWTQMAGGKKRS